MVNHKKFMDIERIKEVNVNGFEKGDYIVIQEKIDGANSAIRDDSENDCVVAQSRKQILSISNNLRGMYEWSQTLDEGRVREVLGDNLCLFGEWLCLSGDTVIRKTSGGKNNNYMTLREMYEYKNKPVPDRIHYRLDKGRPFVFKNIMDNPNISDDDLFKIHCSDYYASYKKTINWLLDNNYIVLNNKTYSITEQGKNWYEHYVRGDSWWDKNGMPTLFSLDFKTDKIIPNKMLDIVYTGQKEVYEIITRKGFSIKATLEHPFLTPKGFVPLKELSEFDCVAISQMLNQRGHRRLGKGSRQILNLQEEYKNKIGKCERCGSKSCLELHHRDRNYTNNNVSNFEVLCSDCHINEHKGDNKFKGFRYDYEFDYIVSINYIGEEDCYDIAMDGDETTANFIANGFIVHNCKHTVKYPDEKYNQFYAYDIYDTDAEKYLPQDIVEEKAKVLGLNFVPVFYKGEFQSWEHCLSFVGKTEMGGEIGEGIVVKNQTKLNDPNSRTPFYIKIVSEKFQETHEHHVKIVSPEQLKAQEENKALCETIVTEPRVMKILHKLVDEGILPENWGAKEMPIVAKNLCKRIFEDCLKEEPETVSQIENFGKIANSIGMSIARKFI